MTVQIDAHLRPLEDTRTPNKSCFYEAVCTVDGVRYVARSRMGATCELARVLVAAGIPDAAMVVTHQGLKGNLTWRSFYEAAKWTYEETATKPLHRVRWEDPALRRARIDAALGPKPGVIDPGGSADAPVPVPA